MFRKCWPKSRSSKILIKIEVFRKSSPILKFSNIFDQNCYFSKILAQIVTFRKFWLQSRLINNFTKLAIFGNLDQNWEFWNKSNVSRKLCPNLKFSPILTKIAIFRKFCPKSRFSTIWPKSRFFGNLLHNRDFQRFWRKWLFFEFFFFYQNPDLIESMTSIEIFSKIWPKSVCFENFDQNWDFQEFWSKSRDFENLH